MALILLARNMPFDGVIADQVGGRSDFSTIQAALDYGNSKTPTAANPWSFQVQPGTYDAENLTLYNYVNLKGAAPSGACKITKSDAANPVITSAVTCTLESLEIGNGNAAQAAVKVTAGTLTLKGCTIYGTGAGDAIQITAGGTLVLDGCTVTVGSIDLVGACTLNARYSRFLDIDVAATATVIAEECDYGDVDNLGTFVDLTGCREYACAVGVAVGEWVYASAADTVAEARANALATMPTIGMVVYKPTTTTCRVKQNGYAWDATAPWTVGDEYFVSDAVAGAIINVMPGVWPQRAGIAVATDRFKVLIGDNLGLTSCNTYTSDAGVVAEEWVYISAANTVDEAQANAAATMNSIGVCVDKPTAVLAVIKTEGKVAVLGKGWAPNDTVYISDTVPGDIVNAPPGMGIVQPVGTVKSDAGIGVAAGLIIEMS